MNGKRSAAQGAVSPAGSEKSAKREAVSPAKREAVSHPGSKSARRNGKPSATQEAVRFR